MRLEGGLRGLDLGGLPRRLAALDQERERRGETTSGEFAAPECEEALVRLRAVAAGDDSVWVRSEALEGLLAEVRLKLAGGKSGDPPSHRLRHLAATLCDAPPAVGAEGGGALGQALAEFDALLRVAQERARDVLRDSLGLAMMPDQTGLPLDPDRHSVTASVSGEDASRHDTVASQEAPGWLLAGGVLVPADVVRYSATSAGAPELPPLEDCRPQAVDPQMLGRRGG